MNTIGTVRRIGILGGSFDPVHVGHLALGQAAISALKLDELVLIPAGNPWQKAGQQADGAHRLAMLRLAVAALPANTQTASWVVDDEEIRRQGPSYTLDTLITLRKRYGPQVPLMLIIGSDQFRRLDSWYQWEMLFDYAHIAVTQRERVPLTDLPPPIEAILNERGTGALPNTPSGQIIFFRMPAVPVSSTMLRQHLQEGQPVNSLLPMGVEAYIHRHGLYAPPHSPSGNLAAD
ncbi:MAG: nicotinate (nicotinamide) nucleotide adenylyltransferase [Lautropia sp.]|nr:nicotinate (nicotinamide) nucleotide adenylyltransferase [Lautropia sp.]